MWSGRLMCGEEKGKAGKEVRQHVAGPGWLGVWGGAQRSAGLTEEVTSEGETKGVMKGETKGRMKAAP